MEKSKVTVEKILDEIAVNCQQHKESLITGTRQSNTSDLIISIYIADNPQIYTRQILDQLNLLAKGGKGFTISKKNIKNYAIYENAVDVNVIKNDAYKNVDEWTVFLDPNEITDLQERPTKISIFW